MSKPIALSKHWAPYLSSLPETGMGYQVVSVFLTDGHKFDQVVVDSGYITRVPWKSGNSVRSIRNRGNQDCSRQMGLERRARG